MTSTAGADQDVSMNGGIGGDAALTSLSSPSHDQKQQVPSMATLCESKSSTMSSALTENSADVGT